MKLDRIKLNNFLVLGRAGLDLYADPPGSRTETAQRFTSALGGSAANIAAAITRLGGRASLVSAISDDAVGRFTLNEMKRYGIGTQHVQCVVGEVRTSLAVVETRAEDCQSVIYRNGAADFQVTAKQVENIDLDVFGALIVTGTSLAREPSRTATLRCMELAQAARVPVILDIDYRPYSWASSGEAADICMEAVGRSTIIIGNDVEFSVLADGGDGAALAAGLLADCVVYKRGEHGSITYCKNEIFNVGIFRVAALKPTGAGDAFMGGFVTGLAEGRDIRACILRGSAAAAIVVTRVGCAPACPTPQEIDDFMAAHSGPA